MLQLGCGEGLRRASAPRRLELTSQADPITDKLIEDPMNGIIYLVGLIVIILAILSFLGLR
jgi:hypothetical protein